MGVLQRALARYLLECSQCGTVPAPARPLPIPLSITRLSLSFSLSSHSFLPLEYTSSSSSSSAVALRADSLRRPGARPSRGLCASFSIHRATKPSCYNFRSWKRTTTTTNNTIAAAAGVLIDNTRQCSSFSLPLESGGGDSEAVQGSSPCAQEEVASPSCSTSLLKEVLERRQHVPVPQWARKAKIRLKKAEAEDEALEGAGEDRRRIEEEHRHDGARSEEARGGGKERVAVLHEKRGVEESPEEPYVPLLVRLQRKKMSLGEVTKVATKFDNIEVEEVKEPVGVNTEEADSREEEEEDGLSPATSRENDTVGDEADAGVVNAEEEEKEEEEEALQEVSSEDGATIRVSASLSALFRSTKKLILDPVQWLAQAESAPLMDEETLRNHISSSAFGAKLYTEHLAEEVEEANSAATAMMLNEVAAEEDEVCEAHSGAHDRSSVAAIGAAGAAMMSPSMMNEEDMEPLTLPSSSSPPKKNENEEEEEEETTAKASGAPRLPRRPSGKLPVSGTDTLIYNVFTRRVAVASSSNIKSLHLLGISVDEVSRELRINNPDSLVLLAQELRAKRYSWPARWSRGVLFKQVEHILCDDKVDDPVAKVKALLEAHYSRVKGRHSTGVITASTAAAEADGSEQQQQQMSPKVAEATDDTLFSLADLNAEQQEVVHFALRGYNTYIGGGAGTGKSVLLRVLKQQLMKEGLSVAVTGTTGIAGCHIGGCTLHHCFGINILGEFTRRKELSAYDVIIIDEVSMLSRELLESLERHLRRANGVDLPFGGVQVILCGDFMQLGAIASEPLVASQVFRSNFAMFKLTTVVRHNTDARFADQLQMLRRGQVPANLQDTVQFLTTEGLVLAKQQAKALRERQQEQLKVILHGAGASQQQLDGETQNNNSDSQMISDEMAREQERASSTDIVSPFCLPSLKGAAAMAENTTGITAADAYIEGAVNLLPTNKQVDETNQRELAKLSGDASTFPAQLLSPVLMGSWSPTYVLRMMEPSKVNTRRLSLELEHFVTSFFSRKRAGDSSSEAEAASSSASSAWWASSVVLGSKNIALYPLFVDALAFRVRVPAEFDEATASAFLVHLNGLNDFLEAAQLGVCVRDTILSAEGLQSESDEFALETYAAHSPMARPITLKVGARVMLRVNLAPGLVNGSLGTVVGFRRLTMDNLPRYIMGNAQREESVRSYMDFLTYEHGFQTPLVPEVDFGGGRVEMVPPSTFYVGGLSNTHHYSLGIVALPLSLAYAFTVHKVQGLTLVGRVHLELSRMWPCEHLLYVAMSRVRNPEQLSISNFSSKLVCVASDCLLYDDSLPNVWKVKVLPHFIPATWKRSPERRKRVLRKKQVEAWQRKKKEALKQQERRSAAAMDAEIRHLQEQHLKLLRLVQSEGVKKSP